MANRRTICQETKHALVTGMEEDSGKLPVGAGGAVDMAVAHASKKSQKIKGKQP